jgi:hypothetical protein
MELPTILHLKYYKANIMRNVIYGVSVLFSIYFSVEDHHLMEMMIER